MCFTNQKKRINLNFISCFSFLLQILAIYTVITLNTIGAKASVRTQQLWSNYPTERCSTDSSLKYLSGNALADTTNCLGPNDAPYPTYVYNLSSCLFNSYRHAIIRNGVNCSESTEPVVWSSVSNSNKRSN